MKKKFLGFLFIIICVAGLVACNTNVATFSEFVALQDSYNAELGVAFAVPTIKFKMSDGKQYDATVLLKDENGADVALEYNTFIPTKKAVYKATFSATLREETLSTKTVDINIADNEVPDITLSYTSKIGFINSVITLPTATITDNSAETLLPRYEILLGETKIDIAADNTFTPTLAGAYVINVYAKDSSNNERRAVANVQISELIQNKVMYFDQEFGLSQIKRDGGRLEFNTDAKYLFGNELGSIKMLTEGDDEYIQMRWSLPAIKNLRDYKEMYFYVYNTLDVSVPFWNNWNTKDLRLQPKMWNKITLWDDGTPTGNWDSYFPPKDGNIKCDASDITNYLVTIACPNVDGKFKGEFYFSSVNVIANPAVADVIKLIDNIPSEVTLKDIGTVNLASDTYWFLSAEDKILVTNVAKMNAAIAAITELENLAKINEVEESISGLPSLEDYTLEFEADLLKVNALYKKLNATLQERVTNKNILIALLAKNQELNDDATVVMLIDLIKDIPEIASITYAADSEYIYMIKGEVDFTNGAILARVTNLDKFNTALAHIYSLEPTANRIFREINLLSDFGDLTVTEKQKAIALKAEYDTLNDTEKQIVKNYAKLEEVLVRVGEFADNVAYNLEQPWIVDNLGRDGGRFEYSTEYKLNTEKGSIHIFGAPEGGDEYPTLVLKMPQIKDIGNYYQIKFNIYNDNDYDAKFWIDWESGMTLTKGVWNSHTITVKNDGTTDINGTKAKTDNFANISMIFQLNKNADEKFAGNFYVANIQLIPFTTAQTIIDEIALLPSADALTSEACIKILEIEDKILTVKLSERILITNISKLDELKAKIAEEKAQAAKDNIYFSSDYGWAKYSRIAEDDAGTVALNKDAAFIHGTDKTSIKLNCTEGLNYAALNIEPFMSKDGYDYVEFYVYSSIDTGDAWSDWGGIAYPDGEAKIKANSWTRIRILVGNITMNGDTTKIIRIAEKGDFYVSSILAAKNLIREGAVFYSADVSTDFAKIDDGTGTVEKVANVFYGSDKSSLKVTSKAATENDAGLKIFPTLKVLDGYDYIEFFVLSFEDSNALAYGNDVLTYPDGELGLKANKWVRVQITVLSLRTTCGYSDDFQTWDYWNIFRAEKPGTYYVSSFNAVKTVIAPGV